MGLRCESFPEYLRMRQRSEYAFLNLHNGGAVMVYAPIIQAREVAIAKVPKKEIALQEYVSAVAMVWCGGGDPNGHVSRPRLRREKPGKLSYLGMRKPRTHSKDVTNRLLHLNTVPLMVKISWHLLCNCGNHRQFY
ncbi:hypothetical protein E2C01_011701 [Portunus trituberculatus]|uniref:Uncharacterized protein n=1 Tax=Portunus trituberculatus TaxID=210409 RepID=A0A5B7DC70_PORTR|nr:hypothetical protein [Portunus trituberculatus]